MFLSDSLLRNQFSLRLMGLIKNLQWFLALAARHFIDSRLLRFGYKWIDHSLSFRPVETGGNGHFVMNIANELKLPPRLDRSKDDVAEGRRQC